MIRESPIDSGQNDHALVDENGIPRTILERGQWKSITTDRVVLVPGPPNEVATVLWIFSAFVREKLSEQQIAKRLNARGAENGNTPKWSPSGIKKLLMNEKYIGHNVWNRTSAKLQGKKCYNSSEMWIRAENAFQWIVPKPLFEAAQMIFRDRAEHRVDDEILLRLRTRRRIWPQRTRQLSDAQMLEELRTVLDERGQLSREIIAEAGELPSPSTYVYRFGSLSRVYELIGYRPDPYRRHSPRPHGLLDCEMLEILRKLWRQHGYVSQSMLKNDSTLPSCYAYQQRFGGLRQAYLRIGYISNR